MDNYRILLYALWACVMYISHLEYNIVVKVQTSQGRPLDLCEASKVQIGSPLTNTYSGIILLYHECDNI